MLNMPKKTIVLLDEHNYLVYIGHYLLKEKGKAYPRERKYLKELINQLYKQNHENPHTLKNVEKIETIKEVFELNDLDII